jgi:sirohydrochlorin cobaltochelatase
MASFPEGTGGHFPDSIVLFAHGSRDPLWRKPIEAIAARTMALAPEVQVRCAYLELTEPSLPDCVAELAQLGLETIKVVPLFLGVGRHAREDLPVIMAELMARYPQIKFKLQPAIGEDTRLVDLVAQMALSDHAD